MSCWYAAVVSVLVPAGLAGCFDPRPPSGGACAPGDRCPAPLSCINSVCVDSLEQPPDAGLDAALTPPDAPPPFIKCPANYREVLPRVCHREVNEITPWLVAEAQCETDGGHLVVPDSAQEAALLPKPAWIGISDRRAEGVLLTVTGRTPVFMFWDTPNPTASPFHCGHTSANLLWTLGPCDFGFTFVCEHDGIPADPTAF
ncbi:MAG: lectin-like protein [Kofleriaceae bacterium]